MKCFKSSDNSDKLKETTLSLQTVFSLIRDQAFCLLRCILAKNINIQWDIHQRRRTKRPVSTNRPQCTAASPLKHLLLWETTPLWTSGHGRAAFASRMTKISAPTAARCSGSRSENENRRTGSRFTKREASLQWRPFISLFLNVVNLLQLRFSLQINWFGSIRCFGPPSYIIVTLLLFSSAGKLTHLVDLVFGELRTKSQILSANYLRFPDRIIRVIPKEMRFSNASQPLSNGWKDEWKTNMAATVILQ